MAPKPLDGRTVLAEQNRNEEREAKQSSKISLASIVMRVRVSRLLYLTTIAVAMVAWLWMLFEGIEWAIY